MKKKLLEQGITDFKKFIDKDCYFVDKTHLIGYLIDHPSEVHLITRPRRFGKTLNMSMIHHFFEAPLPSKTAHFNTPPSKQSRNQNPEPRTQKSEPITPNSYLFNGLAIQTHPRYAEFIGQYPVIHLSFKDATGNNVEDCIDFIRRAIANEYKRHMYLLEENKLNEYDGMLFKSIVNRNAPNTEFTCAIFNLSAWLKEAWGKPVYILLDEYDTPLHSAYTGDYYDDMIAFIKGFMAQTFKDNPYLNQAVVIGILKIAQESIFSGFNNSKISTLIASAMQDCFGFTESDVEKMLSYYEMEDKLEGIKEWYNGYIFGEGTVIYNPWSIVNYLSAPEDGLQPYWINTSDNSIIRDIIQLDYKKNRGIIEKFLNGEGIRQEALLNISYPQIKSNQKVTWSFLLHSGYLKASKKRQLENSQDYRLDIPNREVRYTWENIIKDWVEEDLRANTDFCNFIQGIREMNPGLIEKSLQNILFTFASYHDTAGAAPKIGENFHHGLILGLLVYLDSSFTVDSNREHGTGRPDILIVKKGSNHLQAEYLLIFEFKQGKQSLDRLANAALEQIQERYLHAACIKFHPQKILIIGIGFRGKNLGMKCLRIDKGPLESENYSEERFQ